MNLKSLQESVRGATSVAASVTMLLNGLAELMAKVQGNPNASHALHSAFPEAVPGLVDAVLEGTELAPVPVAEAEEPEAIEEPPAPPKRAKAGKSK